MGLTPSETDESLRRVVARVALLNLAYFGVEFSVAFAIGSVSLFADSIDFLEDTSINFLILIALGWGARNRSRVGTVLAGILLIPGWRHSGRLGTSSCFQCRRHRYPFL
jgi:Co/Zn/Cd efflux system component